jgi:phosphoribosylglycinamide formyltransferase-1
MERLGIIVGPKGRGTNLRALAGACSSGSIPAVVEVVVSPVEDSPAAEFTRNEGLRLEVVPPGEEYGARLLAALNGSTLVCLAGFLRLLPGEILARYPVLNIHPALLPKHGGKGMYGIHVHEAVLLAGDDESGCTVHRVTPVYDEGEIVVQMRCPVIPGETPESLAARVLELEKQAYPEAVRRFAVGGAS